MAFGVYPLLIGKMLQLYSPVQPFQVVRSYELEAEDREKVLCAQDVLQFIMPRKYIRHCPRLFGKSFQSLELCAGIFLPQQLHVFVSKRRVTEAAATNQNFECELCR